MGELILIDAFKITSKKTNKDYILIVLYTKKSKCITKILKEYNEEVLDRLDSYLYEDVSQYVTTGISQDGVLRLDISLV